MYMHPCRISALAMHQLYISFYCCCAFNFNSWLVYAVFGSAKMQQQSPKLPKKLCMLKVSVSPSLPLSLSLPICALLDLISCKLLSYIIIPILIIIIVISQQLFIVECAHSLQLLLAHIFYVNLTVSISLSLSFHLSISV